MIAACLNPLACPPHADRILVIRLGAVGDVARTLPAASSLRAGYREAHVAWLVEPAAASVVEGQPWVDEVIVFPRLPLVGDLRRGALGAAARRFRDFARMLREKRFDLVVDFHSILRSALLARLSGAPRRIGYARPFGRELSYLLATDRARLGSERISRFVRNAALVGYLGVDAPPAQRPFRVDAAARARMQEKLGGGPTPLAMHPSTSDATAHKRYPAVGYAAVARSLRAADGTPTLVTWGPARDDRRIALEIVAAADGAARLAPETPSLADLAALFCCCRLYLGGDTGPMHLASLVGTPVVQLLGPTDAVENAPWNATPSRTVQPLAGGALADIAPEDVVAATRLLLASAPGSRAPASGPRAAGVGP